MRQQNPSLTERVAQLIYAYANRHNFIMATISAVLSIGLLVSGIEPTLLRAATLFASSLFAQVGLYRLVTAFGQARGQQKTAKQLSKIYLEKSFESVDGNDLRKANGDKYTLADFKKAKHVGTELKPEHERQYHYVFVKYSPDDDVKNGQPIKGPFISRFEVARKCAIKQDGTKYQVHDEHNSSGYLSGHILIMHRCYDYLKMYEKLATDKKSEFKLFYRFEGFEGTELEHGINQIEQKLSKLK